MREVKPHAARPTLREPNQPVRGRDAELATLGGHLDRLLTGVGTVVVVEGGAPEPRGRGLRATTARDLYDQMLAIYPDRVNPGVLWISARAVKS